MAKLILSSSDEAYEESYVDAISHRKHAFISHLYPPFYIQVMDAFANYQSLDFEHIALIPSIQKLTNMDMGGSSSVSPLDYEQIALNS